MDTNTKAEEAKLDELRLVVDKAYSDYLNIFSDASRESWRRAWAEYTEFRDRNIVVEDDD